MRFAPTFMAIALVFAAANAALANTDDADWVAKCVADNRKENVTVETITKYCTCMNDKMDADETLSITAWEKAHPEEQKACDKEAGWK